MAGIRWGSNPAALSLIQAIGDSAIYSAALGEIVPQQHLATAYSLRSILGYGMGALSPWLMGIVLDLASPVAGATSDFAWGLAWSALGAVALAGPCMAYRLERV